MIMALNPQLMELFPALRDKIASYPKAKNQTTPNLNIVVEIFKNDNPYTRYIYNFHSLKKESKYPHNSFISQTLQQVNIFNNISID